MVNEATFDVLFDLGAKWTTLDGELHPDTNDVATVTGLKGHIARHAQIDDVVTQFGVDHGAQHGPDVIDVGCRGQAHAFSVRALYDFMSKHPADSGLYVQEEPLMITLTDSAASKVAQLLESEGTPEYALRVAVKSGGCSGFQYDMYFDGDIASDDVVTTFGAVKVVVDPASASLLDGASLDYKDGLTEQGFAITNPNATRSCGCGKSFS